MVMIYSICSNQYFGHISGLHPLFFYPYSPILLRIYFPYDVCTLTPYHLGYFGLSSGISTKKRGRLVTYCVPHTLLFKGWQAGWWFI